jgi:hypothetical protein
MRLGDSDEATCVLLGAKTWFPMSTYSICPRDTSHSSGAALHTKSEYHPTAVGGYCSSFLQARI